MKISKKLCITLDWTRIIENDIEVFRIGTFAFDNYLEENVEDIQIPYIPIPDGIKDLIDPSVLLIFNRSKAKLVWLYSPKDSILYNTNGKRASKKDMRRFMQLMFSIWLNYC